MQIVAKRLCRSNIAESNRAWISSRLLSSRSIVMVLALFIAQPMTGIFKMDAFDTHLKGIDLNLHVTHVKKQ